MGPLTDQGKTSQGYPPLFKIGGGKYPVTVELSLLETLKMLLPGIFSAVALASTAGGNMLFKSVKLMSV
jgi:hypothetical protein